MKKILISLIISLFIVVSSVFLLPQTPWGKALCKQILIKQIEQEGFLKVSTMDVSKLSFFNINIDKLVLESDQMHLEAEGIKINISPFSYFKKNTLLSHCNVNTLELKINTKSGTSTPEVTNTAKSPPWPDLPLSFSIKDFSCNHLTLDLPDFEEKQTFTLHGNLDWNARSKDFVVQASASWILYPETSFYLKMTGTSSGKSLKIDFSIKDPSEEFLAQIYPNLPHFSGSAFVKTELSWETFWLLIQGIESTSPLTGAFSTIIKPETDPLSIEGKFEWTPSKGVNLSSIIGTHSLFHLDGSLSWTTSGNIEKGRFLLRSNDFSLVSSLIGGAFSVDIVLSGHITEPELYGLIQMDHLLIHKHRIQNIEGVLKGELNTLRFNGSLLLNGGYENESFFLSTDIILPFKGAYSIDKINMRYGDTRLIGDLKILPQNSYPVGTLKIESANFADFSPLFGTPVRGKGWLKLEFTENEWCLVARSPKLFIDTVEFTTCYGEVHHSYSEKTSRSLLKAKKARGFSHQLDKLYLELSQVAEEEWNFSVQSSADSVEWIKSRGTFLISGERRSFNILEFQGQSRGKALNLLSPVQISLNSERLYTSPLEVQLGDGQFFCELLDDSTLNIKFNQLPLAVLSSWFYSSSINEGTLSGQGNLNALSTKNLELSMEGSIENLGFNTPHLQKLPHLSSAFKINYYANRLKVEGNVEEGELGLMAFNADLPITLQVSPFSWNVNLKNKSSINLDGNVDVRPFLEIFGSPTDYGKGNLITSLQMQGCLALPKITGSLRLDNGSYESYFTGTSLKDIHILIDFEGSSAHLKSFSAQDGQNGSLSATGNLELSLEKLYPFQMECQFQKATLFHLDDIQAQLSGGLNVLGNLDHLTVRGELGVDRAYLHIPDTLRVSLPQVNVVYLDKTKGKNTNPIVLKSYNPTLDIAVRFISKGNTIVEGRGLYSKWEGDVLVNHSEGRFIQKGGLKLIDGNLNFAGKIFQLTQGNIYFQGASRSEVHLNLVAQTNIDDTQIEASLKGPLTHPYLNLTSAPKLPQSEILSLILFNAKTSELNNPYQAFQLSQTIASISGDGFIAPDLLGKVRKGLKIDQLQVSQFTNVDEESIDDQSNMGIQIGKYITKGILISVNKGISSPNNEVSIEANFLKNIKAKAAVDSSNTDTSWQLQWHHDY